MRDAAVAVPQGRRRRGHGDHQDERRHGEDPPGLLQDDRGTTDNQRWHFWRLEGPGFVWNYRVLPHVHTYVNISSKT